MEAAVEDGFVSKYHQVTTIFNGARLAYNLDACEEFGLDPGEKCNIEDGPNLIMIIGYEPGWLSVGMVDVGLYICQPYNIIRYQKYGETSGSILDPAKKEDLSIDLKVYLEKFAEDEGDLWDMTAPNHLRAIVLSGEASDSAMVEMRSALSDALPKYQHKLRMSLDPHFVGAFGAAQRARHIIQNPQFLRPQDHAYGHIEL